MKTILAVSMVIMAFVGGIFIGYAVSRPGKTSFEVEASPADLSSLISLALHSFDKGDTDRASLLTAAALSGIAEKPMAARDVWLRIRTYLEQQEAVDLDMLLTTMDTFTRNLDLILSETTKIDDFMLLWDVRTDAVAFHSDARDRLKRNALKVVSELKASLGEANDSQAAFETFIESTNAPIAGSRSSLQVVAFDALRRNATTEHENASLKELVHIKLMHARHRMDSLSNRIEQQHDRDLRNEELEPPGAPSLGPYEQLLRDTMLLADALDEADILSWVLLLDDEELTSEFSSIQSELELLIPRLRSLQQLRYNLWAMTQIYAAENIPGWAARLGRINVTFLHPTVSSLYSMAFDRRLQEHGDATERHRAVRTILHQVKPDFSQF